MRNESVNTGNGNYSNKQNDPFNKAYRIKDEKDKWTEQSKTKFEDWKRLIERFFSSGPTGCADLLNYALTVKDPIDLSEKDATTGELVHKRIVESVDKAVELDRLIFNELMSTIAGERPKSLYIQSNYSKIRNGVLEAYSQEQRPRNVLDCGRAHAQYHSINHHKV